MLICIFNIYMNAFQSSIFIWSSRFFFWTPSDGLYCSSSKISLFAYQRWPSRANLHIQDWRERSPVVNIHPIFAIFFWTPSDGLSRSSSKIIEFAYPRWPPWANFYIQDRCKRSPVLIIHPIFSFFLDPLWWIVLCEFENVLIYLSKMAAMAFL